MGIIRTRMEASNGSIGLIGLTVNPQIPEETAMQRDLQTDLIRSFALEMAPLFSTTTSPLPLFFPSFHDFSNSSNSSFFPVPSRPLFQPLTSHCTIGSPRRCRAASLGPPPPPRTDPPPGNNPRQLQGSTSLSKIKDRVQIFLAVLFWMSLFFWTSAWDGRNKPDKGSRRRR